MPTLADIARLTGASTYTVSCALRGVGSVSSAKRAAIQAVAQSLGYQPNGPAALLAGQRHHPKAAERQQPVACLGLRPPARELFCGWAGFAGSARELGLEPHAFDGSEASSIGALLDMLWQRGIKGLYLRPNHLVGNREGLAEADWSRFSVVMEGRRDPALRFHRVRASPFNQMMETLTQVFSKGYRRVGVLLYETAHRQDVLARRGAVLAFRQSELPEDARMLVRQETGRWQGEAREPGIRKWVKRERLEALIIHPHVWHETFLRAAWRIPEEVALASDASYGSLNGLPSLAGCAAAGGTMGGRAAHLLFRLMRIGERGMPDRPLEEVHEPQWLRGATLLARDESPHA